MKTDKLEPLVQSPISIEAPDLRQDPFPHLIAGDVLDAGTSEDLLAWLDGGAQWKLQTIEGFYESYNLDFRRSEIPPCLERLRSAELLGQLRAQMSGWFGLPLEEKVDVEMHRMVPGQAIRVHNDYGSVGQTHRLLIQVNRGWRPEQGGLLMFFDAEKLDDASLPRRVFLPWSRSAVAFEISPRSHHAVSQILRGERFTLVYSFYAVGGYARFQRGDIHG